MCAFDIVHASHTLLDPCSRRYYISLMRHIPATSLAKAIALRLVNAEWSRLVLLRCVCGGLIQLALQTACHEQHAVRARHMGRAAG